MAQYQITVDQELLHRLFLGNNKDAGVSALLESVLNQFYTKLYEAYSSKGRKPAVEPKTFFKILTYAYMNNIYSSRLIEQACRRDINFMWLLNGQAPPDHTTISRFRKHFLP